MKKLVAILIVLFMITSCFAVGMAIAAPDQTKDKERTRAGEEKNVAGGIEVLGYMEDFRDDSLKTTTKNQTKEREGKGYEDEEADSEVEGLSVTGDVTDDFSGDFRKTSARVASVVVGGGHHEPLGNVSLHDLRCLSNTFEPPASALIVPDNYTTIQQAIDDASDGATIFVYNGTYNESLNISINNLTLIGETRDTTVIDGTGFNCINVTNVTNVTTVNVTIQGFTIHNGSAGIYVEAEDASVTVVNNNISVNNYGGVQINATNSIVANITCNIIADNGCDCLNVSTGGGIRLYVNASNGTIDAKIRDNNIEYNPCGGIRIGRWNYFDLPRVCGNITALIENNEISNNKDGSIRIGGAQDTINATVTDNYIGSVEQKRAGGLIRIGRSEECSYNLSPAVVNAVVSGNTIECGNASDNVSTGGIIRIGATDTLNATVNDNTLHGGYSIGGVMRIGHAGHPTNVTARIINNTLDFADGDNIGGIIRIRATDTLDATVNGNNITAGITGDYYREIGGVIRIGTGGEPDNLTATVIGNYIYCGNVTDDWTYGIGGFVRIRAEDTLNATVNNNTIIGGNNIGGFIRIGTGGEPDNLTATVIGNYMEGLNATAGDGTQVGGFVRIRAEDTLDATVNENTIIARNCSIGGVMRIGQDCQPKNLTATVNNNEIAITDISSGGVSASGVGGVIRIKALDNLTATVNENTILGEEEKGGYLLGGGIRIGNCDSDPTGNVTAVVNGNYIAPCKGGAIRIVAKDELNATVNDNTASGNYGSGIRIGYFCWDCGNQSTAIVNATVINNTITDNYGSGIHVSAQDNLTAVIEGNTIADNTYCDNEASEYVASGSGLYIEGKSNVTINFNNIYGNSEFGVLNGNSTETIDARYNWWGASDGPHASPGSGDNVSANVTYEPWLGAPLVLPAVLHNNLCEILGPGADQEIDASAEADTKVIINTIGETVIWVAKYASQPFPEEPFPDAALGKYVDIRVSDPDNVTWPVYVELSYTDAEVTTAGVIEETLGLYYYKPENTFHRCSNTGVNVTENYIWAFVNETEAGYLAGQEFGAGGDPVKVPILSPLGMLALIGLLSVIATISIIRKKEREGN